MPGRGSGRSHALTAPAAPTASADRGRRAPALLALGVLALAALIVASVHVGTTGAWSPAETVRGVLAVFGLGEPLEPGAQAIVSLRLWRTLVAAGVGAALALSGGLLQGVFRNGLAAPSILGVSSGASLGATFAILLLGGYGPTLFLERAQGSGPVVVMLGAFAGAIAVALFVQAAATRGGRISVPTLLLVGVAVNVLLAGVLSAVQDWMLGDFEMTRAVLAWTFGNLRDRDPAHAGMVLGGLALASAVVPFVARELVLLGGGEDDAESLGVDTRRTKLLAVLGAAVAAGSAVAVAGQIAFVGLVVPHVIRLLAGTSHRRLLPLCIVGGAIFLLGTDLLQRLLLGEELRTW
jgi:iron complex transport system permease protein